VVTGQRVGGGAVTEPAHLLDRLSEQPSARLRSMPIPEQPCSSEPDRMARMGKVKPVCPDLFAEIASVRTLIFTWKSASGR
jgi:hypothetical protein